MINQGPAHTDCEHTDLPVNPQGNLQGRRHLAPSVCVYRRAVCSGNHHVTQPLGGMLLWSPLQPQALTQDWTWAAV